jgi:signal transduction histidine kinase
MAAVKVGMHERAQLLGGTVSVQSELGEGTRVFVEVPA